MLASLGVGGAVGATLAKRMAITDLPQMVSAVHAALAPLPALRSLVAPPPCLPPAHTHTYPPSLPPPQVAAFHSLVGLAAVCTSISSYMATGERVGVGVRVCGGGPRAWSPHGGFARERAHPAPRPPLRASPLPLPADPAHMDGVHLTTTMLGTFIGAVTLTG